VNKDEYKNRQTNRQTDTLITILAVIETQRVSMGLLYTSWHHKETAKF